jgi:hypothetical protein
MADNTSTAKTVIGLFETQPEANRAADELIQEGFRPDQIGVIAGHELSHPEDHVNATENSEGKVINAVGKGLAVGGGLGAVAGGLASLLIPGVGPVLVGGALATTFLGAGLGASVGGVMAGLMKAGVDESDARLFGEALRHGGVVLTVHTEAQHARQAVEILNRNGALDMDEHRDIPGDRGVDRVEGSANNRSSDTNRQYSTDRDR